MFVLKNIIKTNIYKSSFTDVGVLKNKFRQIFSRFVHTFP